MIFITKVVKIFIKKHAKEGENDVKSDVTPSLGPLILHNLLGFNRVYYGSTMCYDLQPGLGIRSFSENLGGLYFIIRDGDLEKLQGGALTPLTIEHSIR